MNDLQAEAAWVQQAQAGSAAAFSRLVRNHQQALRAFLRRLCGNHAQADDLAQDTFVFVWEKIGRCDPALPFRPWLFGVGWRKYRQGKRGWARLMRRETRYAAEQENVAPGDADARLDLASAFAALPPEQRAAALLCLGLELTHEEAAQALALPLGTVKSHVARGREKLKSLLGDSRLENGA